MEKLQLQLEHAIKLGNEVKITQFITHRLAKAFWHRHLSDERSVDWNLFVDIFRKLERSTQPPVPPLKEEQMECLKQQLDQNKNGKVSVYGT